MGSHSSDSSLKKEKKAKKAKKAKKEKKEKKAATPKPPLSRSRSRSASPHAGSKRKAATADAASDAPPAKRAAGDKRVAAFRISAPTQRALAARGIEELFDVQVRPGPALSPHCVGCAALRCRSPPAAR